MGVIDSDLAGFGSDDDEAAVERYRYLLSTAPPDDLERTHAAAFEALTGEQRRAAVVALETSDAPAALARVATRTALHRSGALEELLGAELFEQLAIAFVGTVLADTLFTGLAYEPHEARGGTDDDGFGSGFDDELDGSEFATRN